MVCRKTIETEKEGRVEWIQGANRKILKICLCHDECSEGYNGSTSIIGDWIFSYSYDADHIYFELNKMEKENPKIKKDIQYIRKQLFEKNR